MTNELIQHSAGKRVLYKMFFVPVLLMGVFSINGSAQIRPLKKMHPANLSTRNITTEQTIRKLNFNLPDWIMNIGGRTKGFTSLAGFNKFYSTSLIPTSAAVNGGSNDTIPFLILKRDSVNAVRYYIRGIFLVRRGTISFTLDDSLVLNYRKWNVSANNRIDYTNRGILVTDLSLNSDTSVVTIVSQQNITGTPVDISIQNFDIRGITGLTGGDSLTISGLLDAKILLNGLGKVLKGATASGAISQFKLMQQPVGTLQINAEIIDRNTIHAKIDLAENENDLTFQGNIIQDKGLRQVDGVLDIKKLHSAVLQGFIKGMSIARGSVNGSFALKGKPSKPEWKGSLNIDTTFFTLSQLGTTYSIDKQILALDYPAIVFNQFIIKDSLDHSLFINGNLYSKNNPGYDVDLDLTSRGFTFINAPKAINNQIYGYSGMDTRITVKGTTLTPLMEGSIVLNDQTDITMVLPEKNTNSDAASSVVRFISANKPSFPQQATGSAIDGTGIDSVTPLNYKLNITSDKNSLLTIVIDPTTGDELKVKGTARLEVVNGPGGNAAITGIYLLDSGYYELNYQFLKKRFNLMPGSTIRFNGNPMEAQVNIRAEYIANTAARDLLGNEVGSVGTRIARSFNQKIPFRVLLMLRGPLNKPVISFNIELPEDRTLNPQLRRTIENKLVQLRADIAATNKQVFALLVLERFVGEQSIDFFKGNGSDFSDIANESVSKFLSSAMDQIASDLFKGINFDLNLNSYKDFNDNDDVQKTDLNVEVSKNFLNDRLSVSVGRNFGIESQDASTKASQQKARRFLPDVTVNSKLSTDGKYMIRSYKKSPFDVVLDGYVVETGLAFIVTMDYDLFNELFFRKNKKRE